MTQEEREPDSYIFVCDLSKGRYSTSRRKCVKRKDNSRTPGPVHGVSDVYHSRVIHTRFIYLLPS